MSAQAYPLEWPEGWPKRPGYRGDIRTRFGTGLTVARAVDSLYHELGLLGAKSIVLSSNLEPTIRGAIGEAALRGKGPGVAVYFEYKGRPMVMAQDEWAQVQGNIRSLALAIEAMRQLERHGGGYMMERAFSGFAALPPPAQSSTPEVDWKKTFNIEGTFLALPKADLLAIVERRYREAASKAHSDKHGGGDDTKMIILNAAITQARQELKNG